MDATTLKSKYALDHSDLPVPAGTVVEIARLDSSYEIDRQTNEEYVRHELYFKGVRVPLRLNNTRIDILIHLFGKDTDSWIGRKLGLFYGLVPKYGKTEPGILLHQQNVDDLPLTEWPKHLAIVDKYQGAHAAFQARGGTHTGGFQMLPASTQRPASLHTRDTRPFGSKNAEKLVLALKEQGATSDQLLAWLKANDAEAFSAAYGREFAEIPSWVAPAMLRFLRELRVVPPMAPPAAESEPPAPPPEPEPIDFTAGTKAAPAIAIPADDIPF